MGANTLVHIIINLDVDPFYNLWAQSIPSILYFAKKSIGPNENEADRNDMYT